MSMTVVEVLEKGGWTQRQYVTEDNKHCLVGATEATCRFTCGIYDYYANYGGAHLRRALDMVEPNWRSNFSSVEAWNDHPDRTLEDVLLVAKHYDYLTAEGDDE